MIRYAFMGFLSLLTVALFAQPANMAPTTSDTTLLWSISGNGLEQTSYLFGTIHMIPKDDYFLPKTVEAALASAERVAFEIDTREMQDPTLIFSMMSRLQMPGGKRLRDLLEPADFKIVEDYFQENGLPLAMFENWKPMFLAAMVGQDMKDMGMGGLMEGEGDMRSYEFELTEIAEEAEKDIFGLETIEFQMSVFDSIPYEAQAQMLLDAVEMDIAGEEGDDQFSQMVEMYRRQAIVEMVTMIQVEAGEAEADNFEEFLLTRRNKAWIPIMAESMAAAPVFFAVGAGHLAGENGVIKLLREAGYEVEGVYSKQ